MFLRDGKMEFRSRKLWTEVFAEFLATLLFLFMVCGTVLPWNNTPPSVIHIAFSHGLSIATLAMAVFHISGGQLNPAVTITICGAAIVFYLTPNDSVGSLGVTAPSNGVTTAQAFGVELMLTFILVFVIFAATDPNRDMAGYGVPLAIGICVFICLMHGIPSSGASLNPARSLGPAVVMNLWRDHWIYWVAPIVGGLLATCTYQLFFARRRINQNTLEDDNYNVELNDNDTSKFMVSPL
ncbi:Aquaporin AQPAe.a [Stylophora pistillata]|uniref:Aquaporin AQPAe.a n=1 Tax=Stylophora pistillata TaxID=50429 RepID=A0A2B4S9V8_STYPI|nr:Aquaporin AQPAe.a [Stylophora pistillata]